MAAELIRRHPLALVDEGNARFAASPIPGLELTWILGCRSPALRALVKELRKTEPEAAEAFFAGLPHGLHGEDILHAFLLGLEIKPDLALVKTRRFLPHVRDWAMCDVLSPKGFTKGLGRLKVEAKRWLASEHTYTCRFGICIYMTYFLGEAFRPEFLAFIGLLDSEEYHVHMTRGWYLAIALAKQPKATLPWLVEDRLPILIRRKAAQKSIEFFRVPDETKTVLRRVCESLPRRGTGSWIWRWVWSRSSSSPPWERGPEFCGECEASPELGAIGEGPELAVSARSLREGAGSKWSWAAKGFGPLRHRFCVLSDPERVFGAAGWGRGVSRPCLGLWGLGFWSVWGLWLWFRCSWVRVWGVGFVRGVVGVGVLECVGALIVFSTQLGEGVEHRDRV